MHIIDFMHEEIKYDIDVNHSKLSLEQKNLQKKFRILTAIQMNKEIPNEIKRNELRKYLNYTKDIIIDSVYIQYIEYIKRTSKKNYSIMTKLFTHYTLSSITCEECGNNSFNFDMHNTLNFYPSSNCSIYTLLEDEFKKSINLCDNNKYECDYCGKKTNAIKQTMLWKLNDYLLIAFNRFTNTEVSYPIEGLNMSQFISNYASNNNYVYDLYGAILHFGSKRSGHYVSITKNSYDENWYLYDDASITRIPINEIHNICSKTNTYVLAYKLVS
jgi:ubiquitin C-terminal hydrolase